MTRFSVFAALLAMELFLLGCARNEAAPAPPPAPQVSVAQVVSRNITELDEFTGRFQAVERWKSDRAFPVTSLRVNFVEGHEVKKVTCCTSLTRAPIRPRSSAPKPSSRARPPNAAREVRARPCDETDRTSVPFRRRNSIRASRQRAGGRERAGGRSGGRIRGAQPDVHAGAGADLRAGGPRRNHGWQSRHQRCRRCSPPSSPSIRSTSNSRATSRFT